MASPFRAFRKNQKLFMAVATILAMFAFIFIGPWSGMGEPSSEAKNPDYFTWKFGTVTQDEIDREVMMRRAVNYLLVSIAQELKSPEAEMRLQNLSDPNRETVATSMLFAKKAEQMGVVATDEAVNQFLEAWTEGRIPKDRLSQLIRQIQIGQGHLTQHLLFSTLRGMLQAGYAQQMFSPLLERARYGTYGGDTPADRWHDYCQLNKQATVQILPVAVADFVAEIPDPSDNTLRDFYDQYKNKESSPESPTPGFRRPFKAQFQYFKADYDKLLEEEQPKVTEQEIKDYYETNKDRDFRKSRLSEPAEEESKESAEEKAGETAPPAEPQTSSVDDPKKTQDPAPKADENPSPPADSKPETSNDNQGKSDQPKEESKKAPDGGQSILPRRDSSLNGELLALADEPILAQATDAKTPDTKTPDTKTPDTKTPAPAATIPPVEYEPLEKVSDLIRKRIAEEKIDDRIQKAFEALLAEMNKYRTQLGRFRVKLAPKPEPLDFAALAKQLGLEAKETEMISARQANDDTDIGRSSSLLTTTNFRPIPFWQTAYAARPVLQSFEPKVSEDIPRNRYLWWKTADEPANTPPLADIKPEVVQAWKLIEARKPAKAKAEEYAEQVRKAKQPMREVFSAMPGMEVITAGPFSWLTRPLSQQSPEISEVSGVKSPGNEFMRTVFSLDQGETGVTANHPENTFFVVQLESTEPPLEQLENGFMSAMANPSTAQTYAMVSALDHNGDSYRWLKELQDQYDFKLVQNNEPSEADGDQ